MTQGPGRSEGLHIVGESPLRKDAEAKIRGTATYIEELRLAGMLYGKVLRSPHPHARILRIDVAKAKSLRGVVDVVIGDELPFVHGESLPDQPLLARGKVRYAGEAVAAVAAVDEATAERAVAAIEVEYEELPAVFDPLEAARPGAPLLHEELGSYAHPSGIDPVPGTNICQHFQLEKGNVAEGFAASDEIFEDTFTTPPQQHCTIEPHGAICSVDSAGNLTLWANNDSPYRARKEIATALGLSMSRVRVIGAEYIGGNFGSKGGLKAEACAIALAWKIRNRPIRVIFTREEEFCSAIVRHPAVIRLKTGVRRDGMILAREASIHLATGAYAEKGPTVARFAGVSAVGPYRIPNVRVDSRCVYTNRMLSGAMRGYGGAQVAWAYESQMDIIAARLGLDPLALRLRHVYVDGDDHLCGQKLSSEGLRACLEEVAEKMAWGKKPREPGVGRGIACMERAVKTPFGSAAFIKVNEDASVDVLSSTTEVGQGAETILCQIAAEELGFPLGAVRKLAPDTAFTPFDASTTSSRSTFHMGNAVKIAAADAKRQIFELAAEQLEADPEDLVLANGKVAVRDLPTRALPVSQVLAQRFGSSGTVLGRGFYFPDMGGEVTDYFSLHAIFWCLGAQGAEVRVDRETGEVKVLKVYAACDTGKTIHPANAQGQIEGGVATGLGYTLLEDYAYRGGTVLNPSFLDYKIPTALDVSDVEPLCVEWAHPNGPYGAKGMGETTNVATPPAIASAICDAVGIRIKDLPITPDKVLRALREKEAGA